MDDATRERRWKEAVAPLEAAYKERGIEALEAMKAVEPLALWNDKVKDFKALSAQLEASPSEEGQQRRDVLVKEINEIGGWINAKVRERSKVADRKGIDLDLDR